MFSSRPGYVTRVVRVGSRCAAALMLTSVFSLLLLVHHASAAEISCIGKGYIAGIRWSELIPSGRTPSSEVCQKAMIKGRIESGDGPKFAEFARNNHPFLVDVMLWSPGGSVEEALKIGRLIRKALITTIAPDTGPNALYFDPVSGLLERRPGLGALYGLTSNVCEGADCNCASACFLIWAAGVRRNGSVLGVHRPTISSSGFAALPPDRAAHLYRQLLTEIRGFLNDMEVPHGITEIMSDTASNDIRWLKQNEASAMEMAPSIAEWIASSCGAMSKSEALLSTRDRFLHELLQKKWSDIYWCSFSKFFRARDAIKDL
jgi:hypothetical protein